MKRIIFFYLILMAFISCVDFYSKEEKIENGIKKYLSIGMNDFKSYEPVKFGRLDSIYDHTYYPSQNGTYGIATSTFKGYRIFHSFRGKNYFGAIVLNEDYFYFDSLFNVIKVIDKKDDFTNYFKNTQ